MDLPYVQIFGAVVSLLLRGILVESVITKGFRFAWAPSVIESTIFFFFAFWKSLMSPKAMIITLLRNKKMIFLIALLFTISKGLTWIAFLRLSYPTTVMLKSCKLVTVMVGNTVLFGSKFGIPDYFAALLAISGVWFFTMGSKTSTNAGDTWFGLSAGIVSLFVDAVAMNLQERILKTGEVSIPQLLMTTSVVSILFMGIMAIAFDEVLPAFNILTNHLEITVQLGVYSVLGYLGTLFRNIIIKRAGCVFSTGVELARKFATVLLSFVFFPKPFTLMHGTGFVLFAVGSLMGMRLQSRTATVVTEVLPDRNDGSVELTRRKNSNLNQDDDYDEENFNNDEKEGLILYDRQEGDIELGNIPLHNVCASPTTPI